MSDRVSKALENHSKGYNCCQSVACAYCDLVGIKEEDMFKIGEAFGGRRLGFCSCFRGNGS